MLNLSESNSILKKILSFETDGQGSYLPRLLHTFAYVDYSQKPWQDVQY